MQKYGLVPRIVCAAIDGRNDDYRIKCCRTQVNQIVEHRMSGAYIFVILNVTLLYCYCMGKHLTRCSVISSTNVLYRIRFITNYYQNYPIIQIPLE